MFSSKYNNMEYCFYDDHMTINGVELEYAKMSDIAHKGDDDPAIIFTYEGQRINLRYNKEEYKEILSYFIKAKEVSAAQAAQPAAPAVSEVPEAPVEPEVPAEPAEPEFVYEPEEPAAPVGPEAPTEPAEPEFVYEPEEPAAPAGPEAPTAPAEPEFVYEPGDYREPAAPVEETAYAEPAVSETPVESEAPVEPAEPESLSEPAEPEIPSEPEVTESKSSAAKAKIGSIANSIKGMPKKKLIIAAAILAAIVVAIILALSLSGKSIDGIDSSVETSTIKSDSGREAEMTIIDDDVTVDKYALSFYNKRVKGSEKEHWLYNKATNEAILFLDQNGTILICVYEHVDGEENNPDLLGAGPVKGTWLLYPDTGKIVKI